MNIVVLDTDFKIVYILDTYESLIWVDRYNEAGDFEIYTPYEYRILDHLRENYYLQIESSRKTMIIEKIELMDDVETGMHLIITGRSLESILDRRVLFPERTVSGPLQTIISDWLTETIINPTSASIGSDYMLRKIDNFIFNPSTDPAVTSVSVPEETYNGDSLYEVVTKYCQDNQIGYEIILDNKNRFVFSLYSGTDRSADQLDNPLVLFSKQYSNISSSDFYSDRKGFKNFCIITRNSGESTIVRYYGDKVKAGLSHREHFHSSNAENTTEMEYYALLELANHRIEESLTGEIDPYNNQFKYDIDYFIGDIVQVGNELIEGQARITEYTINISESGTECYPTFEFFALSEEEA